MTVFTSILLLLDSNGVVFHVSTLKTILINHIPRPGAVPRFIH